MKPLSLVISALSFPLLAMAALPNIVLMMGDDHGWEKTGYNGYPGLEPAGELNLHLPPWDDDHGTRIWPNVIPLPEGYPAPYIALMMGRVNFPGMPKQNWTYGALYLYHGHPSKP